MAHSNRRSLFTRYTFPRICNGNFLDVDEIVVRIVDGYFLKKSQTGLHLRAKKTFTDIGQVDRKAGEQWLVTHSDRGIFEKLAVM